MTTLELMKKINNFFTANEKYFGIYEGYNGEIVIEIDWGDWKHEHAFAKFVMKEIFDLDCTYTEITEEDGSDCYSAIHYFEKKTNPEMLHITAYK